VSVPTVFEVEQHYKARMRAMLPYMQHKHECAYSRWQVMEFLQKTYGVNYSAGPMPSCDCGAAALVAIAKAEVGDV
jgi:hypothetical protein